MRFKNLYSDAYYDFKIGKLCDDSRKIEKNDIFYAINGEKNCGEEFIEEAIYRGAKAVIYEGEKCEKKKGINYIRVDNIRKQLALDCKKFYKDISKKMHIIGVSGTNGKTTTTTLFYKYLLNINKKVCLIGSNGVYINQNHYDTNNTTPSILQIYEFLLKAKKEKVKYVAMEVSSHAIKMLRVYGISFEVIAITNITKDHLDFHKTFDDYLLTKALFLTYPHKKTIINKDILEYKFLYQIANGDVSSYGRRTNIKNVDYSFDNEEISEEKTKFDFYIGKKKYIIITKLLAIFNIYNISTFIAILDYYHLFSQSVLKFLETNIKIDGRMEKIIDNGRTIIIDYAHTPDGVEKVLSYLKSQKVKSLITVIGCGGNRDSEKRSVIGEIATRYSDYCIFTMDSPRDEDPLNIIQEMTKKCSKNNYSIVVDRQEAIKIALEIAKSDDYVAILGKGNEQNIVYKDELIPFNDYQVVIDNIMVR